MRNLRKLTAVVLAVALVLTSMAAAFAATEESTTSASSVTVVNGDKAAVLKELKLYAGTDDTNPAAGLDAALKVQDALIWLATEFGYKAEADKLTDEDATKALAKFADAKDISEYAKKVVAYSAQEGIIAGEVDKAGKLYVRPAASVTAARFATFMLKGLGYDLTGSFTESVAQLAEVDGSKIDADATGDLTRDAAVGFMYGILTAKTESGKTVAENLLAADSSLQTVLSKNSLLPINGTLAVDSVKAVANNKVAVTLKEAAAATAADFAIVKKGTTTAVAVKDIAKESDTLYVLETDALTGGSQYTITVNGVSINFTGIAADNTAPTIIKVTAPDTNTFEVEYSDKMDYATATDVANYTWDKSVKTVKAVLNGDRNKITLTTDTAKKNIVYNITIANVKNSDGKVLAKTTRSIQANEDKTAPRVTYAAPQNNRMLVVKFEDANGMNKASLETVANYSINDLAITSATAYDLVGDDDKYDAVVLVTDTQTTSKAYTLTMENLTDNSVLANTLGKTTRSFRGAAEDKSAPTVIANSVKSKNNNLVEISFSDTNAMDAASLEDISNYTITASNNNETLEIISAKASDTKYPDGYKTRKVTLTTAAQEVNKSYKLTVKAVADEFGNVQSSYKTFNFQGKAVDSQPPFVKKVEFVNNNKIRLVMDDEVAKATVIDPTNYSINKDIGSPIKATLETVNSLANCIDLTTQTLSANTTYEITINNVEDLYGNAMASVKVQFVATSKDLDTTAPSVINYFAPNKKELQISFDEEIDKATLPATVKLGLLNTNGNFSGTDVTFGNPLVIDDGKTIVYKATSGTLADASYKISAAAVFADAAGNKINLNSPAFDDKPIIAGSSAANEKARFLYIEQINARKLKVVFDEPVVFNSAPNGLTYEVAKDDTPDTAGYEWYLKSSTPFKYNQTLTFSFASCVRDLAGDSVLDENESNNKTTYTILLDDQVAPTVVSVVAANKNTVEVNYDEDINTKGTYKITYEYTNTAGTTSKTIIGYDSSTSSIDGSKVILKTTTDLKSGNNYYLEVTGAATDLANNREALNGTRWDFGGSDIAQPDLVKGVGIINATKIFVTATNAISNVVVTEKESGAVMSGTISFVDSKKVNIPLLTPILSGVTYVAQVTYTGGVVATENIEFTGNTPDIGLSLVRTSSTQVELPLNGYDVTSYDAKIYSSVNDTTPIPGTAVDAVNQADDKFTFAAPGNEYIVVLYAAGDTTVLYASKVKVEVTNDTLAASLVAAAKAALTLTVTSPEAINSTISLPDTSAQASVTWSLTNGSGSIVDGVYTTPDRPSTGTYTATLTATISAGSRTDTKTFTVTIHPTGTNNTVVTP